MVKTKVSSRCEATIKDQQGSKVRCRKYHNHLDGSKFTGPMAPVHTVDGFMWREGDTIPNRFSIDGLWLTGPGGRIVKPGPGESASENGDFLILSAQKLQDGVRLEEFEERLCKAKEWRNKRFRIKEEGDPKDFDMTKALDEKIKRFEQAVDKFGKITDKGTALMEQLVEQKLAEAKKKGKSSERC